MLEPRLAEGRNERFPALTVEILKADPQVIVVFSAPATRALKQATATIPIVMWGVGARDQAAVADRTARHLPHGRIAFLQIVQAADARGRHQRG